LRLCEILGAAEAIQAGASMTRGTPQPEQRAFGRRESRIHAFVRVPGRPPEPCVVRNFSEGGALLAFPPAFEPPARFRLTVEAKGVDVMCEVRRRNGEECGVAFVDEASDVSLRLVEGALAGPSATTDQPPPSLLGAGGLVLVVPGHELRSHLIM
jgi:hypothetical protein